MCPVLLFYVPIVILVVGTRAGELNSRGALGEVAHQMMVQELTPIVAIKSQHLEWQGGFNLWGGCHDACCTFVKHRSISGLTAVNVRVGHTPDEVAFQARAAVRYGVGLQISGAVYVPVVVANRDLVL